MAELLSASPREILLTSRATESNNASLNTALKVNPAKRHRVTSAVEHSSVPSHCRALEAGGFRVRHLPVDRDGLIKLADLQSAITNDPAIVSLMWANDETGVLFPVQEIAGLCRGRGVFYHCDAVQAAGKVQCSNVAPMPRRATTLPEHCPPARRANCILLLHDVLLGSGPGFAQRTGRNMEANTEDFDYEIEPRDCIEGMRARSERSVDIVVTSPPYNLGIKYGNYKDTRSRNEYLDWSREWAKEVKRVLRDDGSFFLNLGACPSNPLVPHELVVALKGEDVGFVLQNTFHWIKSISIVTKEGKVESPGHFKPLHSNRFVNDCHEYIFHLTKHGKTEIDRLGLGVPYSDKSNIARWSHTKGRDLRCRGNNWFIPYKTIVNRAKERPHPATFPVELAENCILIHGCSPDLIMLDPFVGIGHSAIAARRCGIRKFIGFDIDPDYVRMARLSWQQVGQLPQQPDLPRKE